MINFRDSNLPDTTDQMVNCKYWLERFGTKQVIRYKEIDKTLYLEQANFALRTSKAAPYFGRCCHLCEETDVAFAAVSQRNRVMWCLTCGRSYFQGNDITDYTQWNPPRELPDDVAKDIFGDDAEAVMYAAGMSHLVEQVKQITSDDIDVSEVEDKIKDLEKYFVNKSNVYYDPETKMLCWDNPEIRKLNKTEVTPIAKILLFLIVGSFLAAGILLS